MPLSRATKRDRVSNVELHDAGSSEDERKMNILSEKLSHALNIGSPRDILQFVEGITH